MVRRYEGPPSVVNHAGDCFPFRDPALRGADMKHIARRDLDILNVDFAIVALDSSDVVDLPTLLGVEGGPVQDDPDNPIDL